MILKYHEMLVNVERDTPDEVLRDWARAITAHLHAHGIGDGSTRSEMAVFVDLLSWKAHEIQTYTDIED